jgi:hypothetical protein
VGWSDAGLGSGLGVSGLRPVQRAVIRCAAACEARVVFVFVFLCWLLSTGRVLLVGASRSLASIQAASALYARHWGSHSVVVECQWQACCLCQHKSFVQYPGLHPVMSVCLHWGLFFHSAAVVRQVWSLWSFNCMQCDAMTCNRSTLYQRLAVSTSWLLLQCASQL